MTAEMSFPHKERLGHGGKAKKHGILKAGKGKSSDAQTEKRKKIKLGLSAQTAMEGGKRQELRMRNDGKCKGLRFGGLGEKAARYPRALKGTPGGKKSTPPSPARL